MERAALYRRALEPIFATAGALGVSAAALGWFLDGGQLAPFAGLWLATAILSILVTFALVRQQAWRADEPFWTPPSRRLVGAVLPGLVTGGIGTALLLPCKLSPPYGGAALLALWHIHYGLALMAAGFCTTRGVRRLGCAFLTIGLAGCAAAVLTQQVPPLRWDCLLMGLTFGIGHLVAALWLRMTKTCSRP